MNNANTFGPSNDRRTPQTAAGRRRTVSYSNKMNVESKNKRKTDYM